MRGWLAYGALVHDWPPETMRRQRIGDLHAVFDAQAERLERTRR